jgi:hypothetical protein
MVGLTGRFSPYLPGFQLSRSLNELPTHKCPPHKTNVDYLILTLNKQCRRSPGLWLCGGAGQHTDEILQTVRSHTNLGISSKSILFWQGVMAFTALCRPPPPIPSKIDWLTLLNQFAHRSTVVFLTSTCCGWWLIGSLDFKLCFAGIKYTAWLTGFSLVLL